MKLALGLLVVWLLVAFLVGPLVARWLGLFDDHTQGGT